MTNHAADAAAGVLPAVTELIDQALDRVLNEQRRVARLLARGAKCRQLSALYEREARLWTLLARHNAHRVYWRAATEARCAARDRAREYAELARLWDDRGEPGAETTGGRTS